MTAAALAGLGVGLALLGFMAGLHPAPSAAASVLRALEAGRRPSRADQLGRRPDRVVGARLAQVLDERGRLPAAMSSMVRAAQTSVEALCAEALLGAAAGVAMPVVVVALMRVGGIRVPLAVPVWASVVLGAAGLLLPFSLLRATAAVARRSARAATAAYLDLVVLCLAGGMGIEGALHAAAGIADDEFSTRIAAALDLARDAGDSPWDALSALGEDLGVLELTELAAAVRLAGTEGARIRSTLSVKAASIRRHELAEAEAEANTVTERLFLPGALLLVGFLLFIGYPAVARIAGGL
jgi:Flp pilus assembly protein TadB